MIYTALTRKAMQIAYTAHHGQVDLAGAPYIFHVARVAEQMDDEASTCAALLHDVIEDTGFTIETLELEFPPEVTDAVKILTRKPGETYFEYIERVKENSTARKVKLADLEHNSDLSRFEGCNPKFRKQYQSLQGRYTKAIAMLREEE